MYSEYLSEERLLGLANQHRERFRNTDPFPHVYVDDFLEPNFVRAVEDEFASTRFGGLCKSQPKTSGMSQKKKVHCFHKAGDENEGK